jgi:hypothetical protein
MVARRANGSGTRINCHGEGCACARRVESNQHTRIPTSTRTAIDLESFEGMRSSLEADSRSRRRLPQLRAADIRLKSG